MKIIADEDGSQKVSVQYGQCRLPTALAHYWELRTQRQIRSTASQSLSRRELDPAENQSQSRGSVLDSYRSAKALPILFASRQGVLVRTQRGLPAHAAVERTAPGDNQMITNAFSAVVALFGLVVGGAYIVGGIIIVGRESIPAGAVVFGLGLAMHVACGGCVVLLQQSKAWGRLGKL